MYPQRSVMTCGLATALEPPHFNPRTRVGCDAGDAVQARAHAGFNPRTRVGCDKGLGVDPYDPEQFQSTHPRGVRRPGRRLQPSPCPCFNPRTRVGCDIRRRRARGILTEFQSTHPRGVRRR